MKHIIDIETWERRDNYNFFRNFHNSWISITSEVDCTEAFPAAKAAKRSFFLYYLYAVLRAANEVKEFRFRTDKNGQVVYHDQVDIISPIAVPGKTFYTVRIPYHADFERFYAEAYHIVHNIPEEGDPYGAEKVITEQGDFDIIQLSATPQLYFTSLTYTQMAPDHPLDYPLMNAGKVVPREGRLVNAHRFHCKPCFCGRSAHRTTLSENRGDIERAGSINRGVSKGIKIPVGHVCMHFPTYTFTYIHKRINNQKKKTICQNADAREYDENTQTVSFKTGHPHTPALSF